MISVMATLKTLIRQHSVIVKKNDTGAILQGNMASVCKAIDDMSDYTKCRTMNSQTNHEFPTTEENSQFTFLNISNHKCSKSFRDKDIIYSKKTDSLWCLPCALFVNKTSKT